MDNKTTYTRTNIENFFSQFGPTGNWTRDHLIQRPHANRWSTEVDILKTVYNINGYLNEI